MSVRMRHTREHTANRRSHHAIKGMRLSACTNCGEKHLRHKACMNCGMYRGRQVIDVASKIAKKQAKIKARNEEARKAGLGPKEKKADEPLDPKNLSKK